MSITQKDVIEYLLELTLRYRLVERALENCDAWFINEGGQIDGWTPQDLKKHFLSHKLVFKRSDWGLIYIDTQIALLVSNDRMIGHYRLISTLDGEIDDDYLILDMSKSEWEQLRCNNPIN